MLAGQGCRLAVDEMLLDADMAGGHLPRPYDIEYGSQSRTPVECAADLVAGWPGRQHQRPPVRPK